MLGEIGSISTSGATLSHDNASLAESKRFLKALLESNQFAPTPGISNQKVTKEVSQKTFEENLKMESRKVDYDSISKKVEELIANDEITVKFDKDADTKIMIMKFVDKKTEDVLKQFPAEVSIKIAKMISKLTSQGNLTDAKV